MAIVVIADKEQELAELYAASLERHGHDARVWMGRGAASAADVLVVDTLLPAGAALVHQFRSLSPGLIVIATGIHPRPGRDAPCLGAEYLEKPFDLADLEAAVARAAAQDPSLSSFDQEQAKGTLTCAK